MRGEAWAVLAAALAIVVTLIVRTDGAPTVTFEVMFLSPVT